MRSSDGYVHNVFLSYRRFGEWPEWVAETFLPIFTHWLGEEIGTDPGIFFDVGGVDAGCTWPSHLGDALARSRIIVPLWSRLYFNSPWCLAELAHMCAREELCGLRTKARPEGLIVPALIHDGEALPSFARGIQAALLQDCANVRMTRRSPSAEKLELLIKRWVPSIAQAIHHAPPFDSAWRDLAIDKFVELFQTTEPRQLQPPLVKSS